MSKKLNTCVKSVGGICCAKCYGTTVKHGVIKGRQRYLCKRCKITRMEAYINNACNPYINSRIANYVREGCGIRSIARLLVIPAKTVLDRIKRIAATIKQPAASINGIYEVDELRTYIKNRSQECWVIYAIDKQSGQVIDLKVGRRTKNNLQLITDKLLLANCKHIYTDGLNIYKYIIPKALHKVRRYGINKIERKNLSLRTHLKRLNRKTICYSKSLMMLEACLKIYFWASCNMVVR